MTYLQLTWMLSEILLQNLLCLGPGLSVQLVFLGVLFADELAEDFRLSSRQKSVICGVCYLGFHFFSYASYFN